MEISFVHPEQLPREKYTKSKKNGRFSFSNLVRKLNWRYTDDVASVSIHKGRSPGSFDIRTSAFTIVHRNQIPLLRTADLSTH